MGILLNSCETMDAGALHYKDAYSISDGKTVYVSAELDSTNCNNSPIQGIPCRGKFGSSYDGPTVNITVEGVTFSRSLSELLDDYTIRSDGASLSQDEPFARQEEESYYIQILNNARFTPASSGSSVNSTQPSSPTSLTSNLATQLTNDPYVLAESNAASFKIGDSSITVALVTSGTFKIIEAESSKEVMDGLKTAYSPHSGAIPLGFSNGKQIAIVDENKRVLKTINFPLSQSSPTEITTRISYYNDLFVTITVSIVPTTTDITIQDTSTGNFQHTTTPNIKVYIITIKPSYAQ